MLNPRNAIVTASQFWMAKTIITAMNRKTTSSEPNAYGPPLRRNTSPGRRAKPRRRNCQNWDTAEEWECSAGSLSGAAARHRGRRAPHWKGASRARPAKPHSTATPRGRRTGGPLFMARCTLQECPADVSVAEEEGFGPLNLETEHKEIEEKARRKAHRHLRCGGGSRASSSFASRRGWPRRSRCNRSAGLGSTRQSCSPTYWWFPMPSGKACPTRSGAARGSIPSPMREGLGVCPSASIRTCSRRCTRRCAV